MDGSVFGVVIHPIDENHQVVTLTGKDGGYLRSPCSECPWRKDQPVGAFPAEAFRHSAATAYDASYNKFACHMSGVAKVKSCAGFLLRNADNNIGVRLELIAGSIDLNQVTDGGLELYASYRDMAVANGVPPDDPALLRCRDNDTPAK